MKKFLGIMLAFVFIFTQAVCVFAAPSPQAPSTGGGNYGDDFTDVIKDETALKIIDYINNTDPSNADAINTLNDLAGLNLDGGVLINDFSKFKNPQKDASGMYEFSIEALNLPDNVKAEDVRGIVFYQETGKWEIITPYKLVGKTFYFRTYTKPSAAALYFPTSVTTTSPVTGVVSSYGVLISAATLATVASSLAHKKSKED